MNLDNQSLDLAMRCHQSGNLQQAERIYRQILQTDPTNVDAHHLLGLVALQVGQTDAAIDSIRQALRLKPDFAEAHSNLGMALRQHGQLPEAIDSWRQAIRHQPDHAAAYYHLGNAIQQLGNMPEAMISWRHAIGFAPNHVEAHNNLAIALQQQGKLEEAIAHLQLAMRLRPDYAQAHHNLGNVFLSQGKLAEAIAKYQHVLRLQPNSAAAYNNLGKAFLDQGELDQAAANLGQALRIEPTSADAHNNLGLVRNSQGQTDDAIACFRHALQLKPDSVEAYNHLGNALQKQGHFEQAIDCYRRAIAFAPDFADAHFNLGTALQSQGNLEAALASCREGIRLQPDAPAGHNNLGNAWKDQGKLDEAIACYRRTLELRPDDAGAHSNLLLTLQHCEGVTPAALAVAHSEYESQHATSLRSAWKSHNNVRDPNKKLRLGLVSADLGAHPVGYFLIGALENLDPSEIEVVCYSDRLVMDAMTKRIQTAAPVWRDVIGLSDEKLAQQVREDQIDILADLAGHAAPNRLLVFARKSAPIQLSWAGYVGTTGLTAMDYLVADRFYVPEEDEHYYCERILRLPDVYVCYSPPSYAPAVKPLPALISGQITFGSFNNPAKVTAEVIQTWARILKRVPGSRMMLKYRGMSDPMVKGRFIQMFAGEGIEPGRLEFHDRSPHAELLEHYNRMDIALDTFPYSGGLTTCEALWMGVPVVTCPGATFASRHSLSYLSVIGLTETICLGRSEYVDCAVALAGNLSRLAEIRAGLRQQVAGSPLCDGPRFARNLAAALRQAWRHFCAGT